ncbi:MAG: Spore germination protein-like protein [Actinomycetia bacterium]|nr:Spore germination protein-like protein [Actinomycetes bacterium]
MRFRLLFLGALAVLAAGCGSTPTAIETVGSTTTQVPVSPKPIAVTVFTVDNGLLRPRVDQVPHTTAVAEAALGALGLGAAVTSIVGGTATVALDHATQDQAAEIVYTLTQFSTVQRVDVGGRKGLTRDDFASYVPPIFVEVPAAGANVPGTFHVSGTASVFEATLVVQLVRNGKVIEKRSVTASEGAPGRGTFDTTFNATPGALTVAAFSPSAADGTPQHEVDVPVTVLH